MKYTVIEIEGGAHRVLNPEGVKIWEFTGFRSFADANRMANEHNTTPGMKVRGPSVYGGWQVFFGRKKIIGGLPSQDDAICWAAEHNPDGSRKEPLGKLLLNIKGNFDPGEAGSPHVDCDCMACRPWTT
jgi:hypothetical protein